MINHDDIEDRRETLRNLMNQNPGTFADEFFFEPDVAGFDAGRFEFEVRDEKFHSHAFTVPVRDGLLTGYAEAPRACPGFVYESPEQHPDYLPF